MAYFPSVFTKDGATTTSDDIADEYRLLWEGWARVGAAPEPDRMHIGASLADLDALEARLTALIAVGGGGTPNPGTGTGYTAVVDPFDSRILLVIEGSNAQVDADPAVLLLTTVAGGSAQVDGTNPNVLLVTI